MIGLENSNISMLVAQSLSEKIIKRVEAKMKINAIIQEFSIPYSINQYIAQLNTSITAYALP